MSFNPRRLSDKKMKMPGMLSWTTPFQKKSSTQGSRGTKELKCYKHSARVVPPVSQPTVEKHDFEMIKWQETFDAMGQLKSLDTVSETKYVPSTGVVERYYTRAKGSNGSTNGDSQSKTIPRCVQPAYLPVKRRHSGSRPTYLCPKSTVRVTWGIYPLAGEKNYTHEDIWDWLGRFGRIVFVVNKGPNCMLVAYEDIESAQKAVNATINPRTKITVAWQDPNFANYGYYNAFKNYTFSSDDRWIQSFGQHRKTTRRQTLQLHLGGTD